jgi:hypothetical protein
MRSIAALGSPSRFRALAAIQPALVALAALALAEAGCHSTQVGATCSLGVASDGGDPGGGTEAIINPSAAECAGNVCVLPTDVGGATTGPLCSVGCSSDSDCDNGEVTHDPADPRCKTGFSCAIVTTVGKLCCRKFCVCRDFLGVSGAMPTPLACIPGGGGDYPNVR